MKMEYREAKEYCVMLLYCRKAIDKAIEKFRKRTTQQEVKMLQKLYTDFDPEGDKMFKNSRQEVPWVDVRWGKRDDTFKLERPEAWLRSFREALGIYKSIHGAVKYSWLVNHYSKQQSVRTMAIRYGVTRSTVYDEINEFKNILLIVAVQNGLLTIEKNRALEEEGQKGDAQDV